MPVEIVAQAQGVLMERRGLSGDQAFTALRVHSQRTGLALSALADQVTASTRVPPTLAGAPDAADPRG